jgi:hypothetical protein
MSRMDPQKEHRSDALVSYSQLPIDFSLRDRWILYSFLATQVLHSILVLPHIGHEAFSIWKVPLFFVLGIIYRVDSLSHLWDPDFEKGPAILVTLATVTAALRAIAPGKRWAWGFILIMGIDVVLFSGLTCAYAEQPGVLFMAAQLIQVPLVIVVLIRNRRAFRASWVDLIFVATTIMAGILIIIVRARYYPVNEAEWDIAPPLCVRILFHSNNLWPQENSLALLILCYFVFMWIFMNLSVWRGKTES